MIILMRLRYFRYLSRLKGSGVDGNPWSAIHWTENSIELTLEDVFNMPIDSHCQFNHLSGHFSPRHPMAITPEFNLLPFLPPQILCGTFFFRQYDWLNIRLCLSDIGESVRIPALYLSYTRPSQSAGLLGMPLVNDSSGHLKPWRRQLGWKHRSCASPR